MKDHQETVERFKQYLDETLGQHGRLSTPTRAKLGALPYHLRDAYDFHTWTLFDRDLIVVEAKASEKLTPTQLSQQVALLGQIFGTRVVVLAMEMAAPNRKRLIEHKVPFVVPGRQMYLPDLMIDLREHFNATKKTKTKLLPSAQLTLFYHLLRKPLSAMHLTALARLLDYTPMTAMRAVDNLEGAGLCETEQLGRDRVVVFPLQSKALWEKAEPFLTTPIEKEVFVAEVPGELVLLDHFAGPRAGRAGLKVVLHHGHAPIETISRRWISRRTAGKVGQLRWGEKRSLERKECMGSCA